MGVTPPWGWGEAAVERRPDFQRLKVGRVSALGTAVQAPGDLPSPAFTGSRLAPVDFLEDQRVGAGVD